MFTTKVDNEIDLVLVHEFLASQYCQLVKDNSDYLSKWLAWVKYCQTDQDFLKFIRTSLHDYAEGQSMICGILFHQKLIGTIGFNKIYKDLKKVEIGYWIIESAQGKGIVTRACQKLISIAFDQMQMQKVQISVATENTASRNICHRLNMTLEGIITNAENVNGYILNHAVYGLYQ